MRTRYCSVLLPVEPEMSFGEQQWLNCILSVGKLMPNDRATNLCETSFCKTTEVVVWWFLPPASAVKVIESVRCVCVCVCVCVSVLSRLNRLTCVCHSCVLSWQKDLG